MEFPGRFLAPIWTISSHSTKLARVTDGTNPSADRFRDRVIAAAEAALKNGGSVGPLELLQHMGLLHPVHVAGWRKGNEHYRVLEPWIQVGPEKFQKTLRYFAEWVKARGLRPIQASYNRRTPSGTEHLQVTADGNPESEKFYRTHYAPAELIERRRNVLLTLPNAPRVVRKPLSIEKPKTSGSRRW